MGQSVQIFLRGGAVRCRTGGEMRQIERYSGFGSSFPRWPGEKEKDTEKRSVARVIPSQPKQFETVFARVKARFDERPSQGLVCKRGFYGESYVLKLQKASWTNDPMDRVQNKSGIFFSVWISAASLRKNRASYNIHALKLRQLKGYRITSRDFASDFRRGFAAVSDSCRKLGVDYRAADFDGRMDWHRTEPFRRRCSGFIGGV